VDADDTLSKAMTDLYEEYNKELDFGKVWSPENELGINTMQTRKDYKIAYIEGSQMANYYDISVEYRKQQVNIVQQTPQGPLQIPQEQVGFRIISQGWH
jgi:radical SAM superfamily enzyme